MNTTCGLTVSAPSEALSPYGVFVLDVDYLRLRELPMSDALGGELDRATIVPRERFPENVVAMHTRCVYLDESTGERPEHHVDARAPRHRAERRFERQRA